MSRKLQAIYRRAHPALSRRNSKDYFEKFFPNVLACAPLDAKVIAHSNSNSNPYRRSVRCSPPLEAPAIPGGSLSSPYPSRSFRSREPLHRRNGKIRAREVRVLDEKKQQLGVMSLNEA